MWFEVHVGEKQSPSTTDWLYYLNLDQHMLYHWYWTLFVIITIMSYSQHGSPWPSLATHLYRPSLPGGFPGYILYRQLLYIGSSWLFCLCSSMWRGPQGYIAYEFILTSSAVSHISGSSNVDSFCEGKGWPYSCWFCGVLPPGLVQYSSQHCVIVQAWLLYDQQPIDSFPFLC